MRFDNDYRAFMDWYKVEQWEWLCKSCGKPYGLAPRHDYCWACIRNHALGTTGNYLEVVGLLACRMQDGYKARLVPYQFWLEFSETRPIKHAQRRIQV